jgi:hypothetical protein
MKFINRLLGKLRRDDSVDELLVPLLAGMVQPFQNGAVIEEIGSALREVPDDAARGRFVHMLWQVCLSSILSRIEDTSNLPSGLSDSFKKFALAQWQRSPGMTLKSEHKIFDYTRQQIGNRLNRPSEDTLIEIGVTMLSLAIQNQEQFSGQIALEWGRTASSCWRLARLETDKALRSVDDINFETVRIDEQVFSLNYSEHYSEILGQFLTKKRVAELYLFRGWTAQFGFRIFVSDPVKADKLLSEVVNSTHYLGLWAFEHLHDFSIESELGDDYMSLIEDRWGGYDSVIPMRVASEGVPTREIISLLVERLGIEDGLVFFGLSTDFIAQLAIAKEAVANIDVRG